MTRSLREVMIGKSEEGLMDYLTSFQKYTPEAISAAVDELRRRGKHFSDEQTKEISTKIEIKKNADSDDDNPFFASDSWKKNVVTDPNAPLLYSKGTITAFSIIFCTIFGAVLLSFNIYDTKRKSIVIGFGILYTALTIWIVNLIPSNTFWVLLLNTAGGVGLTSTFWDQFVGKEIKYRSKPIWKALLISIIIAIAFLLALIYG